MVKSKTLSTSNSRGRCKTADLEDTIGLGKDLYCSPEYFPESKFSQIGRLPAKSQINEN